MLTVYCNCSRSEFYPKNENYLLNVHHVVYFSVFSSFSTVFIFFMAIACVRILSNEWQRAFVVWRRCYNMFLVFFFLLHRHVLSGHFYTVRRNLQHNKYNFALIKKINDFRDFEFKPNIYRQNVHTLWVGRYTLF